MKDYIPLLQSLLWVSVTLGAVFMFRAEIALVRQVFAERLKQGASLKFGPFELGEIRRELRSVRKDLDEVNEKVRKVFLATISQPMYDNLRKLASGRFGNYERGSALERELYHLRDICYISVPSINAIPKTGPNLSDYVQITDAGREFVELRERHAGASTLGAT